MITKSNDDDVIKVKIETLNIGLMLQIIPFLEKELTKVMIFIMMIIIKLNLKLKRSPKCVKEYIL